MDLIAFPDLVFKNISFLRGETLAGAAFKLKTSINYIHL